MATLPRADRRTWLRVTGAAGAALALPARADLVSVIAAAKPSVLPVGTFSATDSPRFGFRGTGFAVGDGTLVATAGSVRAALISEPSPPMMTARSAERPISSKSATSKPLSASTPEDSCSISTRRPEACIQWASILRDSPTSALWYLPISATCRNIERIGKLHH